MTKTQETRAGWGDDAGDPLEGRVAPLLREGETVRLVPGGDTYTVERVSSAAAYLRALYAAPREVVIRDEQGVEVRRFTARTGSKLETVSRRAFVYRDEGWNL